MIRQIAHGIGMAILAVVGLLLLTVAFMINLVRQTLRI